MPIYLGAPVNIMIREAMDVEERERYPPAYFVQPPLRKGVNSSFSN